MVPMPGKKMIISPLFVLLTTVHAFTITPFGSEVQPSRVSSFVPKTTLTYKNNQNVAEDNEDVWPTLNKNKDSKIAIYGGGFGGMALALYLVDACFHYINVYESVREIKEIGVGINIQQHAVRELIELGLCNELERVAVPTGKIQYYHMNGQVFIHSNMIMHLLGVYFIIPICSYLSSHVHYSNSSSVRMLGV